MGCEREAQIKGVEMLPVLVRAQAALDVLGHPELADQVWQVAEGVIKERADWMLSNER